MKEQRFYREPWTRDRVDFLAKWWPHFGTYWVSQQLGLSRPQVKAKVEKTGLKILPKAERLCVGCREEYQFSRYGGLHCRSCHLLHRKQTKRGIVDETNPKVRKSQYSTARERWIALATNTARHRSVEPSDITTDYMIELWDQQKGLCFYSGLLLKEPTYGILRHPYSASIDRVDSQKGYIRGNVVWCAWICNRAKSNLSADEYITLCSLVVHHQRALLESGRDIAIFP